MRTDDDRTPGVGTDGSLESTDRELAGRGADRSGQLGDGVGTDGSLDSAEKHVDPADVTDPEFTDREG